MTDDPMVDPLRVSDLAMTFGATRALAGVDLRVRGGEVHAVLGENGSGKSTLIKVLAGYHRPDPGATITVGGRPLPPGSPDTSYRLGCRFVHQDLALVGDSSVLDNLSLTSGYPTRLGSIRRKAAVAAARKDLARVGLDIDPASKLGEHSPAVQTGVAVARALRSDPSAPATLLVFDEPTATLPENEVNRLLDIVRRVASSGIGVIYVTHRLDEVFAVADTVTVLRDGHLVATRPTSSLDRPTLVELLLGDELEEARQEAVESAAEAEVDDAPEQQPALRVRALRSEVLEGIDLDVRPRMIVGIAGITGSGRETLLSTIFGGAERDGGEVTVAGRVVPAHRPDAARDAGVAYLPPDRKISGGFMQLDARENMMISDLRRFTRWGQIRRRREADEVSSWMTRLDVAPAGAAHRPLATFSGGNQQKILFAKWLRRSPAVFLLDEPTQGVDIGAKALLHHDLVQAAAGGMAIVISSTDIDELAALCQVVHVLRRGRLAATLTGSQISVGAIARAAIGPNAEVAA